MRGLIVLVRHAATTGGGGRAIGRTPLPLSAEGMRQAQELAHSLAPIPFAAVYSSPAARARDTLAPLLDLMGYSPVILPELDEINLGAWDGLTFEEIRTRFPEAYAERGSNIARFRPPGETCGESFEDVDARVHNALVRIAAGPLPALVMTHAGCIRTVLCRCLGTPLNDLFRYTPQYAQCHTVIAVDGTFHLQEPVSYSPPCN